MLDCSALPTSPTDGAAAHVDEPHLARRHAQRGARALLGDQLGAVAGGAGDLGAATGTQLHAVDRRADRDVAQRQVVAGLDVGVRAGLDRRCPGVRSLGAMM